MWWGVRARVKSIKRKGSGNPREKKRKMMKKKSPFEPAAQFEKSKRRGSLPQRYKIQMNPGAQTKKGWRDVERRIFVSERGGKCRG